jgi:hypothetical protein
MVIEVELDPAVSLNVLELRNKRLNSIYPTTHRDFYMLNAHAQNLHGTIRIDTKQTLQKVGCNVINIFEGSCISFPFGNQPLRSVPYACACVTR